MKIIITGGGTGGHIYPGISLAKEFQNRDKKNEIIFVGTSTGMEADIIPREGYEFASLKVKGIKREICLDNIYAIFLFLGSLFNSFKLIKKIKPDLVIGTGGYVSGSISLMSALSGVPVFIHEQNALPGITNKALSIFSRIVFTSFPESEQYFWKKKKVVFTGNPVRKSIWNGDRKNIISKEKMSYNKKTILVFGGSKGANAISQVFLNCIDLIDDLSFNKWQVLLISGREDYSNMLDKIKFSKHKASIYITPYMYNMEDAYDLADLVICRSGATTIAELTAVGLPSILIPYPYATGNHQMYNAMYLKNKQAAVVIAQQELSEKRLAEEISKFLLDNEVLSEMAENSRKAGNRNTAKEIIDLIYNNIKKEV